jgi:hypothetical protein
MSFIYDVWHHIDTRYIRPNPSIASSIHFSVDLGTIESHSFEAGVVSDESQLVSSYLTNIHSFLSAFPNYESSEWS